MVNLQVSNLSLSFSDRTILSDISFSLSEKSRVALMGSNGCGKSTLLKAISNNIEAESMNIAISKGARVSYLPQSDIVPEGSNVYEAAEQWRTIILFIPAAISQIVLPILSSLANTETNKYWKVLKINMLLNGGVAFIIAIFVSLLSGYIMNLYGAGFGNRWPLIILSLSTVFSALANVVGLSISSRAKMWMGFIFNTLWAAVFIIMTKLMLEYHYGALGVSLALLSSYIMLFLVEYRYLKRCSRKENDMVENDKSC